jgi:hypothetical protein
VDVGRGSLLQDPGIQARVRECYLRDLKEVLLAARPRTQASTAPQTQPRYMLNAGGADGGIDGSAEIEPTPVVCSSANQPILDESVLLRKPCSKQAPCFMVFTKGPIYGALPTGDPPENSAKMNFAMETFMAKVVHPGE